MATYAELFSLRADSALRNRVAVAVVVKAQSILDAASPTASAVTWAKDALDDPMGKAASLLNYVLAANSAATVTQIENATDAAIQTNVSDAVDVLIGA